MMTAAELKKNPEVLNALRGAMKAGRKNELLLISNIEDFAPPEVKAAYDRLLEAVAVAASGAAEARDTERRET